MALLIETASFSVDYFIMFDIIQRGAWFPFIICLERVQFIRVTNSSMFFLGFKCLKLNYDIMMAFGLLVSAFPTEQRDDFYGHVWISLIPLPICSLVGGL